MAGLAKMGFASYEEMHERIIQKDTLDDVKWEHTMTVPMRFAVWCSLDPGCGTPPGPGFGDTLENGRLVYLMFFDAASPIVPPP